MAVNQLKEEWYNDFEITKYYGMKLKVNGLYSRLKRIDFTQLEYGPYSKYYVMILENLGIHVHLY